MTQSKKGFSWKKLATAIGIGLVCLALVDTAYQWKSSGSGVSPLISGNSNLAFVLVGMIVGLLSGIAMAFGYFIWKEKKLSDQPDDLTLLLEELSKEEALYSEDNAFESEEKNGDTLEPWERPTDWWKGEED